jgi:hypothetical protein
MHVFGLTEKSEYVAIAGHGSGVVFAGRKFADWLIDNSHLEKCGQDEAQDGDIVFYFEGSDFRHAGFLDRGRVISKWGLGGLYEHELLEVPSS